MGKLMKRNPGLCLLISSLSGSLSGNSTSILEALPGKLNIRRRKPGIHYFLFLLTCSADLAAICEQRQTNV